MGPRASETLERCRLIAGRLSEGDAAAEVAVGLAIIVALYRSRQTIDTQQLDALKG